MTKKSTTSTIAIVALCISILNAAFSFFQWWNSESENRIAAAVEISKNFLKERDVMAVKLIVSTVSYGADSISQDDAEKIARHADFLSYIALLTNKDRLNRSYLADTIVCEIFFAEKAISNLQKKYPTIAQPDDLKEMQAFVQTFPCGLKIPIPSQSN